MYQDVVRRYRGEGEIRARVGRLSKLDADIRDLVAGDPIEVQGDLSPSDDHVDPSL